MKTFLEQVITSVVSGVVLAIILGVASLVSQQIRQWLTQNWRVLSIIALFFLCLLSYLIFAIGSINQRIDKLDEIITTAVAPDQTPTSTVVITDDNILRNGHFNKVITGDEWEWNDILNISMVSGYKEQAACLIPKAKPATDGWFVFYQRIAVMPGQAYTFSGWLNWSKVKDFHVKAEWYDEKFTYLKWDPLTGFENGVSSGWIKREGKVIAPLTAKNARIVVLYNIGGTEDLTDISACVDELTFAPAP